MMGDLTILMLMRARSLTFSPDTACYWATMYGRLDTLEWMHANGYVLVKNLCTMASQWCHLHILQWARGEGFLWNETVCANAAKNGDLEMLQWARANGCPWDEKVVCKKAAKRGYLHILQWAVDNGCVLDETACRSASYRLYDHVATWLDAQQTHGPRTAKGEYTSTRRTSHIDIILLLLLGLVDNSEMRHAHTGLLSLVFGALERWRSCAFR